MNLSELIKTAEELKYSYDVLSKLIDINPCELGDDAIKGLTTAKEFIEGILEEWGIL